MTTENQAKREYLMQYQCLSRSIALLLEEKEYWGRFAKKMEPALRAVLGDNSETASVIHAAQKLSSCEKEIDQRIDEFMEVKLQILSCIAALPDARHRELLRRHYLLGHTWERVAQDMHFNIRWVMRLHIQALSRLDDLPKAESHSGAMIL